MAVTPFLLTQLPVKGTVAKSRVESWGYDNP